LSRETLVEAVRVAWLTLAFMMLLSRATFQAAGPTWMRSFLDGWQSGGAKRLWGAASLAFSAYLIIAGASRFGELSTFDALLLVALVGVLLLDGLVNVLPAGFETFKTRLQDAWVARHRGTGREGDRHLFGTVNALLAVAAAGVAAAVIAYRPIATQTVALAAVLAAVLTAVLIGASILERRRR
jgi:hypothetical protein